MITSAQFHVIEDSIIHQPIVLSSFKEHLSTTQHISVHMHPSAGYQYQANGHPI